MTENVIPLRQDWAARRQWAAGIMAQEEALALQWERLFDEWDATPIWRYLKWRRGLRAVEENMAQRRALMALLMERSAP